MGTQTTRIDPVERDLAAAQLDEIVLANRGRPWTDWKDVVLAWHLEAAAKVRAEAWIPGLTHSQDPVVEKVLSRFYPHHMRLTIEGLQAERLVLRRKLFKAVACARFYEGGGTDAGERARSMLEELEQVPWVPLIEHLKKRSGTQTGSMALAITDLEQELASGKRQSMRRGITTDAPELLPDSFWSSHRIDFSSGVVTVYPSCKDEPRRLDAFAAAGAGDRRHVYFVLRSDDDGPAPSLPVRRKRKCGVEINSRRIAAD
jgi:hypothetical protein